LWAVLALGAGLLAGRHLPQVGPVVWFACACGGVSLALLYRRRACALLLFAAVVCFGAGWFSVRFHQRAADDLGVLLAPALAGEEGAGGGDAGLIVTLEGVVRDPPELAPPARSIFAAFAFGERKMRFTLDAYAAGEAPGRRCRGVVMVRIGREGAAGIESGQIVRVTGRFAGVGGPLNPGEPDWRLWAAQEGRVGSLDVPGGGLVHVAGAAAPAGAKFAAIWRRLVGGVRQRARSALLGRVDSGRAGAGDGRDGERNARALLGGLLLGVREAPDAEVGDAFIRLGLLHVLAISGFHLAVLAAGAMFAMRLTGDHARLEPVLVGAAVLAYLVIVPAQTPVIRSGVMVLAFLAAEASGRRYDRLALLGWIAFGVLLWRPLDLWGIGFELSFGVTAALLWRAGYVRDRLFGAPLRGVVAREAPARFEWLRTARRWCVARAKDVVSASLLAWGVATPTIACQAGVVSIAAPLASIVVLPLVMVMLWLGYLTLLIGMIAGDSAAVLVRVLMELAEWWAGLTVLLDEAPLTAVRIGRVTPVLAAAATGLIVYWFVRGRWRDRRAWFATAVVAAWLAAELWAGPRLGPGVRFRADMLAVGDGTCILLRSGDEAVLWDCGSRWVDVGRRTIPQAVRALGAARVSTVVVTHPDLDHFCGLPDVVEPLGVERVVVSPRFVASAEEAGGAPAMLMRELEERGVEVVTVAAGDGLAFGEVTIELLNPAPGARYTVDNDTSLVGLVHVPVREEGGAVAERRMLLTGDVQAEAIGAVMAANPGLDVDVMELPHHGSATTAALEFVRWAKPEVVLQSTGPSRVGDVRWLEVKGGREWFVTAVDGACFVKFFGDGGVRSGRSAR
jgi:competence protein ComEC